MSGSPIFSNANANANVKAIGVYHGRPPLPRQKELSNIEIMIENLEMERALIELKVLMLIA